MNFSTSTDPNVWPNCFGVYGTRIKEAFYSARWGEYLAALIAEKKRSDAFTDKAGVRPYPWEVGYNTATICSLSQDLYDDLPQCQKPKAFLNPVECVIHFITEGVDINPELC